MKSNVLQKHRYEANTNSSPVEGKRVAFASLGCAKALVDSEKVLGKLLEEGLVLTDDYAQADVIVVNTCGFLESAENESMEAIREAVSYKKEGRCQHVIALGCLAERRGKKIKKKVPGVDAVIGVRRREKMNEAIRALMSGLKRKDLILTGGDEKCNRDVGRYRMTRDHTAYLKVAEGCDNTCTFCIIPDIRGGLKSKQLEDLRAETEELVQSGVREINIIGQDTSDYGRDVYGERRLGDALRTIADVDGVDWVRLLYAYPGHLQDDAINVMRDHPNVVPYLDVPIQHISKKILKRMSRGTSQEHVIDLVEKLRDRIPEIAIRTTLIVGFPGEGKEEFEELKSFVQEYEFERLGVFEYSDEESAPSRQLDQKVPEDVIEERWDELMQIQQEIAREKAEERVGDSVEVLLEKSGNSDGNDLVGRTEWDAPEQDPVIYVNNCNGHQPGDLIDVNVTGATGYDLIGEPVHA
jgi:ribosomal protein S12 methylthiotransferase